MGRPVLPEFNGVVGSNDQTATLSESREPHSSPGVRDEVEEGRAERAEAAVVVEAIADGYHSMLSNTKVNVPRQFI